jgi:hypothetical protein
MKKLHLKEESMKGKALLKPSPILEHMMVGELSRGTKRIFS